MLDHMLANADMANVYLRASIIGSVVIVVGMIATVHSVCNPGWLRRFCEDFVAAMEIANSQPGPRERWVNGDGPRRAPEPADLPDDDPQSVVMEILPGMDDGDVLFPPPMCRDPYDHNVNVTLRQWIALTHPNRSDAWPDVVRKFYTRAALVPEVASYFAGVEDMEELQRHFLASLLIVTGHPVTVGAVRRLHAAHLTVRNREGDGITGEVYELVALTLVTVIRDALMETRLADTARPMRQVARIAEGLRPYIVAA